MVVNLISILVLPLLYFSAVSRGEERAVVVAPAATAHCDWCSVATGLFVVAENAAGKTYFIRRNAKALLKRGFAVRPRVGAHAKDPFKEWKILGRSQTSSLPIFFGSPHYFCLDDPHEDCACENWHDRHPTIFVKVVLPPYDVHLSRVLLRRGRKHKPTPPWIGRENYAEELQRRRNRLLECAKINHWPVYSSFRDAFLLELSDGLARCE